MSPNRNKKVMMLYKSWVSAPEREASYLLMSHLQSILLSPYCITLFCVLCSSAVPCCAFWVNKQHCRFGKCSIWMQILIRMAINTWGGQYRLSHLLRILFTLAHSSWGRWLLSLWHTAVCRGHRVTAVPAPAHHLKLICSCKWSQELASEQKNNG